MQRIIYAIVCELCGVEWDRNNIKGKRAERVDSREGKTTYGREGLWEIGNERKRTKKADRKWNGN